MSFLSTFNEIADPWLPSDNNPRRSYKQGKSRKLRTKQKSTGSSGSPKKRILGPMSRNERMATLHMPGYRAETGFNPRKATAAKPPPKNMLEGGWGENWKPKTANSQPAAPNAAPSQTPKASNKISYEDFINRKNLLIGGGLLATAAGAKILHSKLSKRKERSDKGKKRGKYRT